MLAAVAPDSGCGQASDRSYDLMKEKDMLPDKVQELAGGPNYAARVTLMPDGTPQCQMTWIDHDGEYILVNTESQRQVAKNVRLDPRMTVMIFENPYSFVEVRGTVVETIGGEVARAHIDKLAMRYTGKPYGMPIGPNGRTLYKLRADKVTER
jgi:PPOX class probable F420-dependent enzyme